MGAPYAAAEDSRTHDRKDRHGFRKPRDAVSPPLAQEEEDCGDQRTCVTDATPEHEVDDVKSPRDRLVHAPNTEAQPKA